MDSGFFKIMYNTSGRKGCRNKLLNKKHWLTFTVLLAIFLIALFLRLSAVWFLGFPPENDALQYHQIALNQLAGYGHAIEPGKPTTMRPPVYPLFLAGIYALTGPDYRHALYAQAILHSLLVFPLFWLGFRMSKRVSVGILSASLFAVHTSFEIVSRLCRENITVVLVVLFLWSIYEGCREPKVGRFVVAGLISGLLGLTNPVFMPLAAALFFASLLWPKSRKFAKLLFIQALISVLIITPWLIRNQTVPDRGQEKHINWTLLYGYYPAFTGEWWWPVTDMVALEKKREKVRSFFDNQGQGQDLTSELREKILSHPLGAVKLAISRILIYWVSPPVGTSFIKSHSAALALITLFLQYIFVIIAIVSMILKLPHNKELFVFLVITLYLSIAYGFTHSIRRYGYPMAPQICLFFSWGCSDIISWIRNQMKKPHILDISRLY